MSAKEIKAASERCWIPGDNWCWEHRSPLLRSMLSPPLSLAPVRLWPQQSAVTACQSDRVQFNWLQMTEAPTCSWVGWWCACRGLLSTLILLLLLHINIITAAAQIKNEEKIKYQIEPEPPDIGHYMVHVCRLANGWTFLSLEYPTLPQPPIEASLLWMLWIVGCNAGSRVM